MPWAQNQHNLFEGIAHGDIKPRHGLDREKAAQLASEGVKDKAKKLGKALMKGKK